jgi:hypothetical protein
MHSQFQHSPVAQSRSAQGLFDLGMRSLLEQIYSVDSYAVTLCRRLHHTNLRMERITKSKENLLSPSPSRDDPKRCTCFGVDQTASRISRIHAGIKLDDIGHAGFIERRDYSLMACQIVMLN